MISRKTMWALAGIFFTATGCAPEREAGAAQKGELELREERLAKKLSAPVASTAKPAPLAKWVLPAELKEVSGLALTADGRLLAHNDEQGRVHVIDPRRGVVLKIFTVGEPAARADFEGITLAMGQIYLLASNGNLYQFEEGADKQHVRFTMHDAHLGRECEFEGVAYQPDSAWFLMPCKVVGLKNLQGNLVIYRWRPTRPEPPVPMVIPFAKVVGSLGLKDIHPSDITIDPATGNYVLISAQEEALIEITPAGEPVRAVRLPGDLKQPEGIAITTDSILIVSDEAKKTAATITLYRWPMAASARGTQ
ncbi:MAG TPA: SdiA-regulated domain-containing protein [Gemmatimonadaceae bacterium]|nr:SdiA-regulated domain-containing protein [Gemmatimonadaceae bacterium]